MDVVEAFETLGLDEPGELSAEQLKRSYLRKVRQHPPERDPEGFQRVRAAYELLQRRAGAWRMPPSMPLAAAREALTPLDEPVPPKTQPSAAAPIGTRPSATDAPDAPQPNDALARLRAALNHDKWVAASTALLEMYGEPSLLAQLPPPEIALRICLELFENGKHKTARHLFESFESHMAAHGARLSSETASVWKLLSELSELSRTVDSALTCALAEAIRTGAFLEAEPELRAEMEHYGESELTVLMQARAPTLLAATWPHAKPVVRRKKRGFGAVPWYIRFSFLALFALIKLGAVLTDSHSSSSHIVPAALAAEHRSVLAAGDSEALQEAIGKVDKLYLAGQCDETRAAWDAYYQIIHAVNSNEAVRQGYAARRAQVISVCPTLATELQEEP